MKGHAIIGFNHGVLALAENPARGTGFWSQNTEGVGVLTPKASPSGWVFSQAQHPMIKTYNISSIQINHLDTKHAIPNAVFYYNNGFSWCTIWSTGIERVHIHLCNIKLFELILILENYTQKLFHMDYSHINRPYIYILQQIICRCCLKPLRGPPPDEYDH